MPVLNNKVCVTKADGDKNDDCEEEKNMLYLTLANQAEPIPSYQKVLLLTELHLMLEETGPLSLDIRNKVANMAASGVCNNYAEKYEESGKKVDNVRNVNDKMVALQKVNKIMNNKPWVANSFHIEELRSVSLSLSEIVQALLIMAHFHAVSAIEAVLWKLKENGSKKKQPVNKRNSLINGRIEKVKRKEENNELLDEKINQLEERYILDERLCGISCQRYWDDFGFSVLNCLDEHSSAMLDKRFSYLQSLRNMGDSSEKNLRAIWEYTQNILGFEFVEHKNSWRESGLAECDKMLVEKLCFSQELPDSNSQTLSEKEVIWITVTVLETKLQAEIIYALHAVTQFMNW